MKRSIRLTLALTLLTAAHASAAAQVRVREVAATEQQAERVVITSPFSRVELRPTAGVMAVLRVSPTQPRPQSLGVIDYLDEAAGRKPAGYLVHRHTDGSVTVALTLSGGAGRETRYVHVPADAAVLTLRTVHDNRGVEPTAAASTISVRSNVERPDWLAGVTSKQVAPQAADFAGCYDAARSLNLVVVADDERTWAAVGRDGGKHEALRVGGADWLTPPTIGVLKQRTDDLYLLPVRGVGRVTEASPLVALAAARVDGGWQFGVHPMRPLNHGKLTARVEQKRYEQTVNANPHRPAFVDVPLAVDRFSLRIEDARGRAWLSTDLQHKRPSNPDVRLAGDEKPPRPQRGDAGPAFTAALAALKAGQPEQAIERLDKLVGDDERSTGSLVVLLRAIALMESGQRDEATRTLRNYVERQPGLIEAWLLIGDTARVRKLSRYDKRAWSDAQAALMALQSGRWPTK